MRSIKAVRAAGEEIARVENDRDGKIVVVIGKAASAVDPDLEKWLADED